MAGTGDMWQGLGHVAGRGGMWQVWAHVAGYGAMWQGLRACDKG